MFKSIEKYTFQISLGIAAFIIVFLITISFTLATWKTQMENRIENVDVRQVHLAEKCVTLNEHIASLESEKSKADIQRAEMNIKLTNIEVLVLDIKERLR